MSDDLQARIRILESRVAELEGSPPRRTPRHISRLTRRVAVGLLTLALLVPGVVLASHQFSDVPDSHPSHASIDWLVDSGITSGCGGGNFCPSAAVTRAQMAAFMRRLSGTFELVQAVSDPASGSTFSETASCPAGKRAIGGGGWTSSSNIMMTDSWPSAGTEWSVRWETDDNAAVDPSSIEVWALCAPRL